MTDINIDAILNSIKKSEIKNSEYLYLTANENQISNTAREYLDSKLSDRYFFLNDKSSIIDLKLFNFLSFNDLSEVIVEAKKILNSMLGSTICDINLLSGIHGLIATLSSTTDPNDIIMSIDPNDGGHFLTKKIVKNIGRKSLFAVIEKKGGQIDVKKTLDILKANNVRVLYIDSLYSLDYIRIKKLKEKTGKGVILIYDASHTSGLIAGGVHPSPLDNGADILIGNTHKTFFGPHKCFVAFKNKKYGEKILQEINNLYSSVHTNHLISLAISIFEMKEYGKQYAQQVIKNANKLGKCLEKRNIKVKKINFDKFTNNHQLHIIINKKKYRRNKLFKQFIENNLITNFINCPRNGLFIRIGTQELTRRGMKEKHMSKIAYFIESSMLGKNISNEVTNFNKKFQKIHYSFDDILKN